MPAPSVEPDYAYHITLAKFIKATTEHALLFQIGVVTVWLETSDLEGTADGKKNAGGTGETLTLGRYLESIRTDRRMTCDRSRRQAIAKFRTPTSVRSRTTRFSKPSPGVLYRLRNLRR